MKKTDTQIREELDRLGRPPASLLEREIQRRERLEARLRLAGFWLAGLALAAASLALVMNLWIAVLKVEGPGMEPLLRDGEIVLAVHTARPKKGSVVASRRGGALYINRVIAAGENWVDIAPDGKVAVNGIAVEEPYISEPALGECGIALPCRVPPGAYFVLGDNRKAAEDSRSFGTVAAEQIVGEVRLRLWPVTRLGRVR